MKKRYGILVLAAAVLLLLPGAAGCGGTPETAAKTFTADDFQAQADITWDVTVEKGAMVEATVDSNPTTGYEWGVIDAGHESIVKQSGSAEYVAPEGTMMGASGTEVWKFEAVEKGSTVVTLGYARAWEDGTAPARTLVINVTVE